MVLDVHNHLLCLLYGLAGLRCRLRRLFIYSPRKILGRCMNFPFINLLGELIQPSSISFTFPLASDWFASSLLTRASSLSNFFSRLETEKEIFSSFCPFPLSVREHNRFLIQGFPLFLRRLKFRQTRNLVVNYSHSQTLL